VKTFNLCTFKTHNFVSPTISLQPDKTTHLRAIYVQSPENISWGTRGPPLKGKGGGGNKKG